MGTRGERQRAAKSLGFTGYSYADVEVQQKLLAKAFAPDMATATGSGVVGAAAAVEASLRSAVQRLYRRINRYNGEGNKYHANGEVKHGTG